MKSRYLSGAVAVALAVSTAVIGQTGVAGKREAQRVAQTDMSGNGMTSSEDVRQIQQELHKRGFSVGAIDGVMGAQTKAAVKQFQQAGGLPATGELDQKTKDSLKRSASSSAPGSARSAADGEFSNPNAPSIHGSNTPGASSPAEPGSAPRGGSAGSGVKGSPAPASK